MNNELKKYIYIIHPEMTLFRRFNSKYNQDITSIPNNIKYGVQMYQNPNILGLYYTGDDLEQDNFSMLKYIETKYSNLKCYHNARNFPSEGVPLYVLKYPIYYQGTISNEDYLPLPFLEKYDTSDYSQRKDSSGKLLTTFTKEFRTHPDLTYGVYSKDLGGFIRNPAWKPVVKPIGYSWINTAHDTLRNCGEGALINYHLNKLKSKKEIEMFEKSRNGEIFHKHKFANIYDKYYELYKDDMPQGPTEALDEKVIFNRFNENWDITNGLMPGNHQKDERNFI